MTKRFWTFTTAAVVLAAVLFYLNKDWFAGEEIQIKCRFMQPRAGNFPRRGATPPATGTMLFGFGRKLNLTEVKVVAVDDLATNKYPHTLWRLVSESNSIPVAEFFYGANIRGMHPYLKGAMPDPLDPNVKYRLLVEAGPRKAQHDFTAAPPRPQ